MKRYCEMCDTWSSRRECKECGMPTRTPDYLQDKAERHHERSLEAFYGGDGPRPIQEQYQQAAQQKRDLGRKP